MKWLPESFSMTRGRYMAHVYKIGYRWHYRVRDMREVTTVAEGVCGTLEQAQTKCEEAVK